MTSRTWGWARALLLLVVVAVLGAPAAAAPKADEPDPAAVARAKEHFKKGTFYYNTGELDKAIEEYLAGYADQPDPVFLFNIAQAHRQIGNHERAVFFYKSYLRNSPGAANAETVRARIAELEEIIKKKKESQEQPPTEPQVPPLTGNPPEPSPSASPTPTKVPDPARAAETVVPAASRDPGAPADTSRPVYKKWWFWTAIGVVAVGATVAVVAASGGGGSNAPSADFQHEAF